MTEVLSQLFEDYKITIAQSEYYFYINVSDLTDNPKDLTKHQIVKGYLEALMRTDYQTPDTFITTHNGDVFAREELFGAIGQATGYYDLSLHLIRALQKLTQARDSYYSEAKQKELVKRVNDLIAQAQSEDQDLGEQIAKWHRNNALNATGFRPQMLRSMEGPKGVSGRERIRQYAPHIAASMALADDLLLKGAQPSDALAASKFTFGWPVQD